MRNAVVAGAVALTILADVGAQQQVERLRVRSNTVVVDVVATDRSNRNVTDLSKEDLLLFEDEVPQEIDNFSAAHSPASAGGGPPEAVPAPEKVIHASKEALGNLMVLLLDYATVEYVHQDRVRTAAIRYVRESMHPSDVLAVFRVGSGFELVQNFTSDKDRLAAALETLDPTGSKFSFDRAQLAIEAQNAQASAQLLTSNIEAVRANPSPFGPGVAMTLEILARQEDLAERLEARAYSEASVSKEMQARPVIAAIGAVAAALEKYSGRKTLILFSEGFAVPMALERHLYAAVDRANKANVAVYAIDGGGLRNKEPVTEGELYDISALRPGDRARVSMGLSQFDRAREIGSDQADSTLRYITAATGGFFVRHTNDLFGALQRIDGDLRSYYILTYRPSNTNFDGNFRNIRVKTTRPGVTLRFRQGYYAVPPGASMLTPDEYSKLAKARDGKSDIDGASLSVQPYWFLEPDGRYRVLLSIEYPAALVESDVTEGKRVLRPAIWGTVQDDSGEIVSSFRSPARVRLTGDDARKSPDQRVALQNEVVLSPGRYSIEVYAEPIDRNRPSFELRSLGLAPPEPGLSLSGLVLSNRSAYDPQTSRVEHYPSASRRFRAADKLLFYMHGYNAVTSPDGTAALDVRVTVANDTRSVEARLDPFAVSELESGRWPHAVISRFVELAGLSPGRYQLIADVTDRNSGRTASARASFEVVR